MFKLTITITLVFILSISGSMSQAIYQKTYNVSSHFFLDPKPDGGHITIGRSFSTSNKIALIRVNAFGDTVYTKHFGPASVQALFPNSANKTTDGNYAVVGTLDSFTFPSGAFIMKVTENGDTLWTKTYSGGGATFRHIINSYDGGYVITGNRTSANGTDVLLVKTDQNGDSLWTKCFGNTGSEMGYAVTETTDKGFLIVGVATPIGSTQDALVLKTDSLGNTLWSETFGGSANDRLVSIAPLSSSSFVLSGVTRSFGAGLEDVMVVKIDSLGVIQSAKTIGGTSRDEAAWCTRTVNGGCMVTGFSTSFSSGSVEDIYLAAFDSNLNLLWDKVYGNSSLETGIYIAQTADAGFAMCGYAMGSNIIVKTDSLGNSGCLQSDPATTTSTFTLQPGAYPVVYTSNSTFVTTNPMDNNNIMQMFINTRCTSVGIESLQPTEQFEIFPNPSGSSFYVTTGTLVNENNLTVSIADLHGRILMQQHYKDSQPILLGAIPSGIYIVTLNGNGVAARKKLIVK